MEDVAHAGDIDKGPSFSDEEKEILSLYDQVQKLELEVALAKTRTRLAEEAGSEEGHGRDDAADSARKEDPDATDEARSQLLEAMSLYSLRNGVVNNVLVTNPLLKGIHNSSYASPIEQDLLPWIEARDATSHDVAKQSAIVRQLLDQLTEVESETLRVSRKNRDLAGEVLRLAREADHDRAGAISDDPVARGQIDELEQTLAAKRQKWRVLKGTASGIVAGSGVDWAADPELREVVLDPE